MANTSANKFDSVFSESVSDMTKRQGAGIAAVDGPEGTRLAASCDTLVETGRAIMATTATTRQENCTNLLIAGFAGWTESEDDEVVEDD